MARLDVFLSTKLGRSRTYVQEQIRNGNVRVNGVVVKKASLSVSDKDEITTSFEVTIPFSLHPVEGELRILYEDEDLLAIDKPAGLTVHPSPTTRGDTLVHYLLHHLSMTAAEMDPIRPGIVHRLDRGTSGVMVVAKHRRSQELLSNMFKQREMQKEYEALVWGHLKRKQGTYTNPIGRDPRHRKRMSSKGTPAREAATRFEIIAEGPYASLVRCLPKTGRTHQIRVHLSEGGNPLVGDTLYRSRSAGGRHSGLPRDIADALKELERPMLHSRRLSFTHPISGVPLVLEAPRPKDFAKGVTLLLGLKGE